MNDSYFSQSHIRREIENAVEHANARLASRPVGAIAAGDLFLFSATLGWPLKWMAVLRHPDDPALWYVIAADDNPAVGSLDVELAESHPQGPLVLRCGVGLWVHADDFEMEKRIGKLSDEYVDYARDRLALIVRGQVPSTDDCEIVDTDPDYLEWIDEARRASGFLEESIQADAVVLGADRFTEEWLEQVRKPAVVEEPMILAADAVGMADTEETDLGCVVPARLPGTLIAMLAGQEIDLIYISSEAGEPPPGVGAATHNDLASGEWSQRPDQSWLWSQPIQLEEGRTTFQVGSERFTIEI